MTKKTKSLIFSIPILYVFVNIFPWHLLMLPNINIAVAVNFYAFSVVLYLIFEYLYTKRNK